MIVLYSIGACRLLDDMLDNVETWFHLFVDDVNPTADLAIGGFTEPGWEGYAALKMAQWTPAIWAKTRAITWGEQLRWISPGTVPVQKVYGYYVTDGQFGPLLWSERDPTGPIDAGSPGTPINIYPEFSLQTCPAS